MLGKVGDAGVSFVDRVDQPVSQTVAGFMINSAVTKQTLKVLIFLFFPQLIPDLSLLAFRAQEGTQLTQSISLQELGHLSG